LRVITLFVEINAAVGEGFGRGDSSEWDVLKLSRKIGGNVDRGTQQEIVWNAGDSSEPANPTCAGLHCLPDRFSIATHRRHDAEAGDHNPIVAQSAETHDKHTQGEKFLGRIRQPGSTASTVVAAPPVGNEPMRFRAPIGSR
jgi:hypothetical protein